MTRLHQSTRLTVLPGFMLAWREMFPPAFSPLFSPVFSLRACLLAGMLLLLASCNWGGDKPGEGATASKPSGDAPTFSLAWSEYPSWSVFGVADELGLIDGEAGKMGSLEQKHGVDVELKGADYATCFNMFSSKNADAVCITNMDALIISPSRDCVAVLPTSTSNGADACLVTPQVTDIESLKKFDVYGLEGSVSEYCFARCLEKAGYDEKDFKFVNQDPSTAALQMQQGAETHQAIIVWNPFVLQTLRVRPDVRVLFDSSQIPGEIVDMVVVGKDSLEREGAAAFVAVVCEAFYEVSKAIDDAERGDEVLVALGEKFSDLNLEDMKLVVQQTVFYKSPDEARELLTGDAFRNTMDIVGQFCRKHGLIQEEPSIGFGQDAPNARLIFDATYLPE